jgi:hypothetical protein
MRGWCNRQQPLNLLNDTIANGGAQFGDVMSWFSAVLTEHY